MEAGRHEDDVGGQGRGADPRACMELLGPPRSAVLSGCVTLPAPIPKPSEPSV